MTMGDRIGVLCDGELIQVGTPYEVYNSPYNTFVASFVGAPTINLFDATLDGNQIVVTPQKFELGLEAAARARLNQIAGGRKNVRVGVRPEHVNLVSNDGLAGDLYGAEDHGVEMILTISVADHLIRATSPATTRIPVNAPVQIAVSQ